MAKNLGRHGFDRQKEFKSLSTENKKAFAKTALGQVGAKGTKYANSYKAAAKSNVGHQQGKGAISKGNSGGSAGGNPNHGEDGRFV